MRDVLSSHSPEDPAQSPGMVVIVDDDEQICLALCEWLSLLDRGACYFLSAESLLAALDQNTEGLFLHTGGYGRVRMDAGVIDLNLPGMNGLNLAEILHRRQPTLRVVMITAAQQALTRAIVGGKNDYIVFINKPFSLDALEKALPPA